MRVDRPPFPLFALVFSRVWRGGTRRQLTKIKKINGAKKDVVVFSSIYRIKYISENVSSIIKPESRGERLIQGSARYSDFFFEIIVFNKINEALDRSMFKLKLKIDNATFLVTANTSITTFLGPPF